MMKNNYNDKKLQQHIEYIDNQIKEYESALDNNDAEEDRKELEAKLKERKEKKAKYQEIEKDLKESGEEQISLTDPDSRAVILLRNIVNVGYNIQASSDSKHKLLVEYDTYTCPSGSMLKTNGTWYQHSEKHHKEGTGYRFRRYVTADCRSCTLRALCTQGKQNGRAIDRNEYADAIEENAERVKANKGYYRKRQQVAEHMYGTLKRQRGFTHTSLRGKEKVLGETGLYFIGYNLTRCASVLGIQGLIKALKECCLCLFTLLRGLKWQYRVEYGLCT